MKLFYRTPFGESERNNSKQTKHDQETLLVDDNKLATNKAWDEIGISEDKFSYWVEQIRTRTFTVERW